MTEERLTREALQQTIDGLAEAVLVRIRETGQEEYKYDFIHEAIHEPDGLHEALVRVYPARAQELLDLLSVAEVEDCYRKALRMHPHSYRELHLHMAYTYLWERTDDRVQEWLEE